MRIKLLTMLSVLAMCAASYAQGQTCRGGYCPRPPGRYLWSNAAPAPLGRVAVYQAPRYAPAPVAYVPTTTPPAAPLQAGPADEAGAFLAGLNAWRAAYGRHPVSWDYSLASWAASNAGYHSVVAPGAAQCWAGTSSLTVALEMWKRSPAHASILLNATVSVGAAPCASGATCNAR